MTSEAFQRARLVVFPNLSVLGFGKPVDFDIRSLTCRFAMSRYRLVLGAEYRPQGKIETETTSRLGLDEPEVS